MLPWMRIVVNVKVLRRLGKSRWGNRSRTFKLPRRDSISRPAAPISVDGDDTTT
jgi:hypothetical protein